MIAIITGDIIRSRNLQTQLWMNPLKESLTKFGATPERWEIFRGDEFQAEAENAQLSLLRAIEIKAALKIVRADVRMSIGLGEKEHSAGKISESNGSAFLRSGNLFENLKKIKVTLAVSSGNARFDSELNLLLRFALTIMDNWLPQSAEFVLTAIKNPGLSQEELGQLLGINQAAVSRRQKRSHFDLIMELENEFRNRVQKLSV